MKASSLSTFLARIDAAEYGICRRLNRGASNSSLRAIFKVVSRLGDVILTFPDSASLAVDLTAPHGGVSSRFDVGGRGVPVSVTAQLGNIEVFRLSGAGPSSARHAKRKKR